MCTRKNKCTLVRPATVTLRTSRMTSSLAVASECCLQSNCHKVRAPGERARGIRPRFCSESRRLIFNHRCGPRAPQFVPKKELFIPMNSPPYEQSTGRDWERNTVDYGWNEVTSSSAGALIVGRWSSISAFQIWAVATPTPAAVALFA
jgi:hypothetical protein